MSEIYSGEHLHLLILEVKFLALDTEFALLLQGSYPRHKREVACVPQGGTSELWLLEAFPLGMEGEIYTIL